MITFEPFVQNSRKAERLRDDLRKADDVGMRRRRQLIGLSFVAGGAMMLIGLYQVGVLEKTPSLPIGKVSKPLGKWFDASKVNGSAEAYTFAKSPDAFLGLLSYATTALLGAMGGRDRARRTPWIPIALAGKVTLDAAVAAKLSVDQPTKYKAFCEVCLLAALATFATVPLAYAEARDALRALKNRSA